MVSNLWPSVLGYINSLEPFILYNLKICFNKKQNKYIYNPWMLWLHVYDVQIS